MKESVNSRKISFLFVFLPPPVRAMRRCRMAPVTPFVAYMSSRTRPTGTVTYMAIQGLLLKLESGNFSIHVSKKARAR